MLAGDRRTAGRRDGARRRRCREPAAGVTARPRPAAGPGAARPPARCAAARGRARRAARAPARRRRGIRRASSGTGRRRRGGSRRGPTCGGCARASPRAAADRRAHDAPPPTRRRSSASSEPRSGTPRATTSRSLRAGAYDLGLRARADRRRDARRGPRRPRAATPSIIVGMHFGAIELPVMCSRRTLGHAVTAPDGDGRRPGARPLVPGRRAAASASTSSRSATRAGRSSRRSARGESVGLVNDRDLTHSGLPVPFFGAPDADPAGPRAPRHRDRRARVRRRPPRRPGGRYARG